MGLADFFRGVNQGAEQQYNLENQSRKLAHQDLTLAALQQQYADEMTLKPLELAQNQSAYSHNIAKNLYDTNQVRFDNDNFIRNRDALMLDSTNTANLNAAKSGDELDKFNKTRADLMKYAINDAKKNTVNSEYELSKSNFENDNFIRNRANLEKVYDNNVQNNVSTSGYQVLKSDIDYDVATKNKDALTGIQENTVKAAELQAGLTVEEYAINDMAQKIYMDIKKNGPKELAKYYNSEDPITQKALYKLTSAQTAEKENGAVMEAKAKQNADIAFANGLSTFSSRFIPTNEEGIFIDTQTGQLASASQAAYIAADGNGEAAGRILKGYSEQKDYFAPTIPKEKSALAAIVANANGWTFKDGVYYDSQGKPIDPVTGKAAEEKLRVTGSYFEGVE